MVSADTDRHPRSAHVRRPSMFSRWGAFVYRFRRPIAVLTVVLGIASLAFASQASGELSSGGWLARSSESSRVSDRLAEQFEAGRSSLIVLFRSDALGDATSPRYQAAVDAALGDVRQDERVTGAVGFAATGDKRFISQDG